MMKKAAYVGLLIGGLLLLWFGYDEYQSFQSEVDRFFGGAGSEQAIWMLVGGAACTVTGIVGLLRSN